MRYRHSRPADVLPALPLLAQDSALFTNAFWKRLPHVLTTLIAEQRAISFVVEDAITGKLCFFGITGFATPATVKRVLTGPSPLFRQSFLELELAGRKPFLSANQIAKTNMTGNLSLVHLFGCPDTTELDNARAQVIHRMGFEAFAFSHAGYQIREFWQEAVVPEAAVWTASTGCREIRNTPAPRGDVPARLFRFTREEALANPATPLSHLLKYPPARLGFTQPQQKLLELALLDSSDRAAAAALFVSEAAVKKRWRTIYARLEQVAPELAPPELSGSDRRRELLAYLRQHLEELRPIRRDIAPAGK